VAIIPEDSLCAGINTAILISFSGISLSLALITQADKTCTNITKVGVNNNTAMTTRSISI
jgi:hypothetical protein